MKWMRHLRRRLSTAFETLPSRVLPPETSLLDTPEFVPPGFVHGIEVLNDDKTPMDFVITCC
jgi:hypothetical protein